MGAISFEFRKCHLKLFLIFMLSFGAVYPSEFLLATARMIHPSHLKTDDTMQGKLLGTIYLQTGSIFTATLINISNNEVTVLMENETINTRLPTDMIDKILLSDGRTALPYNSHQLTRSEYRQYYPTYKPTVEDLTQRYFLDGLQLGGAMFFLGYPGAGDEWSGNSLIITIPVPVLSYVALRSGLYSLSYAPGEECDCSGSEYQILAGTNFRSTGLKLYGGWGRYRESFRNNCRTKTLRGDLTLIGAGYHLNHFGFDILASTRDASDYKAQINASYGHTEVTDDQGSTLVFMISYIF